MKRLAIIGAGGHGLVVAEIAQLNGWDVSFFDDNQLKSVPDEWVLKGNLATLEESTVDFDAAFVAIGNNKIRCSLSEYVKSIGLAIPTLVHPSATVSAYATLAAGVVVMAGAVINPYATVGEGVILNTGCSVDHECKIGNYSHIGPQAVLGGNVLLGDLCWIGLGGKIIQGIEIADAVTVGAGAVVIESSHKAASVLVGIPAKDID